MQLVEVTVEPIRMRQRQTITGEWVSDPTARARTTVTVWFDWEELVELFEPREPTATLAYVAARAFLDSSYEIECEHDVVRRGYYLRGILDDSRARIDTTIMAILPRGDAPAKATGAPAIEADNLQPVARQPRRVLHL